MLAAIAGPSGSGKTTIAIRLGETCGRPYVHVSTTKCWTIEDPRKRQECFKNVYMMTFLEAPDGAVLDNALANVAAYARALGVPDVVPGSLLATEAERTHVIVTYAKSDILALRRERRAVGEKERLSDRIPPRSYIHVKAFEELIAILETYGYDYTVIDTYITTPDEATMLAARAIGCATIEPLPAWRQPPPSTIIPSTIAP